MNVTVALGEALDRPRANRQCAGMAPRELMMNSKFSSRPAVNPDTAPGARPSAALVWILCIVFTAAGCASTKVVNQQSLVTERLPRPANVWVYNFAATPADVPPDSAIATQYTIENLPQTAEQIATGRQLGAQIAMQLAQKIRARGLPANQVQTSASPQINDLVLRGYLISIDEGNAAKRVGIGFGAGASEMTTAVEGFQMTAQGLRKLGSLSVQAVGGKKPGIILGAAVFAATGKAAGLIVSSGVNLYGEASGNSGLEGRAEATAQQIADVLEQRFKDQGWIRP
jgi:hypothetical protein